LKKNKVLYSVLMILLISAIALIIVMFFSRATVKDLSERRNEEEVHMGKRAEPDYGKNRRAVPMKSSPDVKEIHVGAVDDRDDPVIRKNSEDQSAELASLADKINGMDSSDDHGMNYLPPKVRELADQIKDMVDSFDDATLDAAKTGLNAIPGVHAEPSEAKLRMSDDGVTLKITIPIENLKIGPHK